MYQQFYGLKCSPFELGPDPRFFFPTPSHNEALAVLSYGVLWRKGFVVVTGEVGTGKTLLVRCLLDIMRCNNIASALVCNPRLSVRDFLAYILNDLRLSLTARTKGEMLAHLNDYLLLRLRRGTTTAIIIDDAHLLEWELFEEIRLLTNLETTQHKLAQLVLVGQPELDQKLDSAKLRQLKQRVSLRCQLRPLAFEQLRGYIHRRLERAGANWHYASIFPTEVIELIYEISRGIPRVINNLCENSLLCGYGKQTKPITVEIVRDVASDLRLNPVATSAPLRASTAEGNDPKHKTGAVQLEPRMGQQ